jgi:hypothetical protein
MAIDPKLYEKYTGKRPGEAMARLGGDLARSSGDVDTSYWAARYRGRKYAMIGFGLLVIAIVAYFLITGSPI